MFEDTICAPATSPVNSALSVIRISGSKVLEAANLLIGNDKELKPRFSYYTPIKHENKLIDDVVLTFYNGPHSFTGEDTIEICCHGNPLIVQKILKALFTIDIRMAEPGEFSKRAFLNGKIDLTEAEAINQVIKARSDWEINAALEQMHGSLKDVVSAIRDKVIHIKADVECGIDFIQEEGIQFITNEEGARQVLLIKKEIEDLYKRCRLGEKISHGIDIPIVGKPNVGKSSLLNLLLNRERAIVSNIPGTTRDLIKETIQFSGIHVNLIDTAGIRQSENEIEKIGIELSRKEIDNSSLIIVLIDLTEPLDNQDFEFFDIIKDKEVIVLANKIDISSTEILDDYKKRIPYNTIGFSAKSAEGLKDLEQSIVKVINTEFVDYKNSYLADLRVVNLLEKSMNDCIKAAELFENEEIDEIIAAELLNLISDLSEITGEISPDDVLDSVFSRFCIGK